MRTILLAGIEPHVSGLIATKLGQLEYEVVDVKGGKPAILSVKARAANFLLIDDPSPLTVDELNLPCTMPQPIAMSM